MKKLYEELYQSCEELEGFCQKAHFVAMKGRFYDENTKKLLLVGRSVNGWDTLQTDTAEHFGSQAEQLFNDVDRWNWIDVVDGVLYSAHNDGKHKKKKDRYCVSSSPFWCYTKAIWDQLPGASKESERWMENIAWSNLYKVSPKVEKNPKRKDKDAQKEICNKILYREMELLKPTHILFLTGFDWFEDFNEAFQDVQYLGKNKTGKYKNDIYVEATAKFQNANVVVMCRPEYRKKVPYVQDAVNRLGR